MFDSVCNQVFWLLYSSKWPVVSLPLVQTPPRDGTELIFGWKHFLPSPTETRSTGWEFIDIVSTTELQAIISRRETFTLHRKGTCLNLGRGVDNKHIKQVFLSAFHAIVERLQQFQIHNLHLAIGNYTSQTFITTLRWIPLVVCHSVM